MPRPFREISILIESGPTPTYGECVAIRSTFFGSLVYGPTPIPLLSIGLLLVPQLPLLRIPPLTSGGFLSIVRPGLVRPIHQSRPGDTPCSE